MSTDTAREGERPALKLELERNHEAPARARAAVATFCQNREISARTIATLQLLVSETVTNAVVHPNLDPPGVIDLRADIDKATVRIEVSDPGPGFTPKPRDPARGHGGYGLFLLERVAASWGVKRRPHTTVWFEVVDA